MELLTSGILADGFELGLWPGDGDFLLLISTRELWEQL